MTISIFVNKKPMNVRPDISLAEVLEMEGIRFVLGVAVAVNDNVIPKSLWASTTLQANDSVLIITATAGG